MHHGTCVTRELRCLSGSLTRGGGENVPGIPGACATRNFTYLVRGPWIEGSYNASAVWSKAFINSRRWQAVAGLCDLWRSRCWRRYSSHRCNRYRVRGLQKAEVHINAHKKSPEENGRHCWQYPRTYFLQGKNVFGRRFCRTLFQMSSPKSVSFKVMAGPWTIHCGYMEYRLNYLIYNHNYDLKLILCIL